MEKLIDAIIAEFSYDVRSEVLDFDRDAIRILIAAYAEEQYQDGFDEGIVW